VISERHPQHLGSGYASEMKVPQTLSIPLFTAPYVQSTTQVPQLRTGIQLGSQEAGVSRNSVQRPPICTDLREPSNSFICSHQRECLSNCLAYSYVNVCSSDESVFYLERGFCKGCIITTQIAMELRKNEHKRPYLCLRRELPLVLGSSLIVTVQKGSS
jgi:hypothetical protein